MADFLHPSLQRDIKRFCLRYGLNVSHAYHTPTDFWNDEGAGEQAVFVCLLHQMPFGEALKLVRAARQRFRNVLLVDYKLPERNLDFPAYWLGHCCERMGAHYGLYDRFMRHGGIEGVIRQLGVVPLRRDVFWGGGIARCGLYDMEVNKSLHNFHYALFIHLPQYTSLA